MFSTFQDGVDHLVAYLGGSPADDIVRDAKRAVLDAYRDIANAHRWSYYYHHGRIITNAPYFGTDPDTGAQIATISYTQTGGAYERMVTLTGDVWPSWAAGGYLRVCTANYRVATRVSATVLTLDPEVNPGADIPSGTPAVLYQDTYLLPCDYMAQDQALYEQNFGGMTYTHPREWLYENRYVFASGTPYCYSVTGDPQYPGRLVIRLFPYPDASKTIDFVYQRRPRALRLYLANAGLAAISASGTTVTGSGTAFNPAMVGCILRLGADTKVPTNETGKYPAVFESMVVAYVSATQLTVADASNNALSGVGYSISDPIDVEQGAMLNVFWRACENHMGMLRILKDKPSAKKQYDQALEHAKSADSRSFAGRSAGPQNRLRRLRLRDMPVGPDEP